jgi:hypothetical protein
MDGFSSSGWVAPNDADGKTDAYHSVSHDLLPGCWQPGALDVAGAPGPKHLLITGSENGERYSGTRFSNYSIDGDQTPLVRPAEGAENCPYFRTKILSQKHKSGRKPRAIAAACQTAGPARTGVMRRALGDMPAAIGFQHPLGGRRTPGELALRADRASDQFAAAVGAHTLQHAGRAAAAEGALERADHGLGGIRRQVPVAALAIRSKLKHRVPPWRN